MLSVSFQYAPRIHDEVSLSSPLKGIERKILQQLPVSEMLYSADLTYTTLQSLNITFLGWTPQLATVIQFVLVGAPPGPIVWEWTFELKINPLIPEGHVELGGHLLTNLGKLPNHWTGQDQIWHTYTDSPGNGHRLQKLTLRAPMGIWRGSRGHQFKNVRKKPNSLTDREQLLHTYEYSSGNGHELKKINPLISERHGG